MIASEQGDIGRAEGDSQSARFRDHFDLVNHPQNSLDPGDRFLCQLLVVEAVKRAPQYDHALVTFAPNISHCRIGVLKQASLRQFGHIL